MTTSPVSSPVAPASTGPAAVVGGAQSAEFAHALARQRASQHAPPAQTPPARPAAPAAPGQAKQTEGQTAEAQADETLQERPRADAAPDAADTPAGIDAWLSRLVSGQAQAQPDAAAWPAAEDSGPGPSEDPGAAGFGLATELPASAIAAAMASRPPQGSGPNAKVAASATSAKADADRSEVLSVAGSMAPALSSPTPGSPGTAAASALAAVAAGAQEDRRASQLAASADAQTSAGVSDSTAALGDKTLPAGATGFGAAPQGAPALAAAATQPAGLVGSAATPLPEARLAAPPGHADFAPQLGAQISVFVREGVQQARLQLNPAEMGPITVQIRLDGSAAQVHLAADNALTRQALEQAMPTLASTLREGGLTLTGGGVFEQPAQPGQADQGGARGQGSAGENRGRGAAGVAAMDESGPALSLDGAGLRPGAARLRGVVDLVA